jgi:hypothetical protein
LWIRIDLIRIRIQHFCSIQIRIQAKTELSKTISFSNFFEIKIWVQSNIGVIHLNFFQKVVSAILYLFSGKTIRIRIHKVSESGSNPDSDPQPCFKSITYYPCGKCNTSLRSLRVKRVLSAKAVAQLYMAHLCWLPEGVAAVCGGALPTRRQQVDKAACIAGSAALATTHSPHRARHGDIRGALTVGLVKFGDKAPFLSRLRHALHMRVQGSQSLIW